MDAGRWTIPASRMKAGREFTVPLSTGALQVLERARKESGGSRLVFPSRTGRRLPATASLRALEAIDDVLTGVDGGGVTASEAIEQLLGAQITLRNNRRLQAAMRSSRLPGIKTLDDFDFSFQPLDQARADRLAPRARLLGA